MTDEIETRLIQCMNCGYVVNYEKQDTLFNNGVWKCTHCEFTIYIPEVGLY